MDSCKACESGQYYSGSLCTACPRGQYRIPCTFYDNTETCKMCLPGKYAGTPSSLECELCGKGTYTKDHGSTQCTNCVPGKYLNETGSTRGGKCLICPDDEFSLAGAAACSPCSAGKYMVKTIQKPAGECVDCPAGTYLDVSGGTSLRSLLCIRTKVSIFTKDHLLQNKPVANGSPTMVDWEST